MLFASETQQVLAESIAKLVYTNPFLPERIEAERAVLGGTFIEGDRVWNALSEPAREEANVIAIGQTFQGFSDYKPQSQP